MKRTDFTSPKQARASTPAAPARWMLAVATAMVVAGCLSPHRAQRDADEAAYDIIREKQQAALGKTEPFTIARPEDELRRRLMLEQKLPAGGAASFGRPYLPPVPKEPEGVSENLPLPEGALVIQPARPRTPDVSRETLATDIFLVDIGRNPESGVIQGARLPDVPVLVGPPAPVYEAPPLFLTLVDALQVAARNSRNYQAQKEQVYLAALDLDLERDEFEFRFSGTLDAEIASELEGDDTTGVVISPAFGVDKVFKSGARLTTRIGLDLARLLSGDGGESLGTFADASITIPLLRGSGVEVVTEGLQQAERDAIYAIWDFESFKRDFAVTVVGEYLDVLGDLRSVENSELNYRSSQEAAERAAALYEEGRLPAIQVAQATQNALQSQERLLLARQQYEASLDSFKVLLGLPPDANVELDPQELENLMPLAEQVLGEGAVALPSLQRRDPATLPGTGPATGPSTGPRPLDLEQELDPSPSTVPTTQEELEEPTDPRNLPGGLLGEIPEVEQPGRGYQAELAREAILIALRNRLDLAVAYGEVVDAQRQTVLAADGLKAGLDLSAGAAWGGQRGALSGDQPDVGLRLGDGTYRGGLGFDLPFERTGERNSYRASLINLDRAIRAAQDAEDSVKLQVLNGLRDLRVTAEDLRIQAVSIQVAQQQEAAARRFFEEGRGEIRDLTEAQDDLVNARNSFISAVVGYRVAQLELQRDLGVLEVEADGLFRETPLRATQP